LLLQVGDWGRDGHDNQTLVAAAMGQAATNLDFVISVGDNFYGLVYSSLKFWDQLSVD
jgi:hypothetical protein